MVSDHFLADVLLGPSLEQTDRRLVCSTDPADGAQSDFLLPAELLQRPYDLFSLVDPDDPMVAKGYCFHISSPSGPRVLAIVSSLYHLHG
jgi:hypothetical protein